MIRAMAKSFKISIISPEKTVYEGEAVSLVVPCESGYLGVLADHVPLVSKLKTGHIFLRKPSQENISFNISGRGFLEVLKNNVSIILDSAVV